MAFCCGVQAIQSIDDGGHGGIKSEGSSGSLDVIVDGLRHTDDRNAHLIKLQAGGEAAIAADDNECADFQMTQRALGFLHDFERHL